MSDAERTVKLDLRELPRASSKRPVLVVLQGQSLGLTVPLDNPQTIIGRGSQTDLTLRDDIASRQHAEIIQLTAEGGCVEYYVTDLGSTNGTFLNGTAISGQALLQDGDKIKVGTHLIKFALLDEFEAEFQERLHQMTQRDDLTGLRSRRSLFADLDREVIQRAASPAGGQISVLMMDLDFFKKVNDGRGHLIGSHTIREVGHIIRDVLGSVDMAARYGGEEYLAYVKSGPDAGMDYAERIRTNVENYEFPASTVDPSLTMHITISLGVASFPEDGASALELVQKADQALFRAKMSGRNRTCLYDPEVDKPGSFHPQVDASAIMYGPSDAQ